MVMGNFFTTKSILVNTYGNYVSDYTQKMTQKKVLCMVEQKCHPMVFLKYKKITFVAGFFNPRDGCLIHLSKNNLLNCFGVKLCQMSSSRLMLVHRCYVQCSEPRNVTGLDIRGNVNSTQFKMSYQPKMT